MLAHVHETAMGLSPQKLHVVFNPASPEVKACLSGFGVEWVPQKQRLGTGHAVQQAMPGIPDESEVMVLYGDLPLLTTGLLNSLKNSPNADLKVLTMRMSNPTGYGRIQRDEQGNITGIIEEKDASDTQKKIDEVNTGIILARAGKLGNWLSILQNENSQGEFYLTDIFSAASEEGATISSVGADDPRELQGVNDQLQLAELESHFRQRGAEKLMLAGVRIADPARIEVRGTVEAGADVSIDINVVLEGKIILGEGVQIGPGCVLRDCSLAAGTRVHAYSVMEGVTTLGPCDIGPFARVRPGTELGAGSRVGNFVEVKNSSLGENTKASHLSYLGDSTIGKGVNIGAGTITCNYDGVNKHRTVIEDGVFIGSDTQLVAPVTIGKNADIGAGSTITQDAPGGKLTLSRSNQVTVADWKRPKKASNEDKD